MKPEKLRVRNAFARAAPSYDTVADFQREAGERLLAECADLPQPDRILDAGCGTGHGMQLTTQRWPDAEILALDFAEPMLRRLPANVRASVLCGDMELLPLASSRFDIVWSSLAMQWCDTARVTREFARVLCSGGHLAATTLGPGTFAELRHAFSGVDEFRHTNDFMDMEVLRRLLFDAKLEPIRMHRVNMQRCFPDLRALLSSVRELGANHVAAGNRRRGLMGKTAWRRFADNYEQMRTDRGLPLTYETYFILARRSAA